MTVQPHDPLLATLARLTAPATTPARDTRVRTLCHAAMTSPAPRVQPTWRRRLVDAALAAGVALYAVSTALEALRIVWFSLE